MECASNYSKGKHGYQGNCSDGGSLEGGGGRDRYQDSKNVYYHDVLHVFFAGRGAGTVILEIKLAQELAKCGPGSTIISITLTKEFIRQPKPGETTAKTSGGGKGNKTMGTMWRILFNTGSSHLPERLTWTSVLSDQRDDKGGTGLTYILQCGSRQHGMSMYITHSGG